MYTKVPITALLAAVLAAGCTPIRVQIRSDPAAEFDQYATFGWIEQPDGYNPAKDLVPGFRKQVRGAVESILQNSWKTE